MPFISWVSIAIFVFCAIMTFRAQVKLNRLARAQGHSVFGDDLIERPWRFWLHLRFGSPKWTVGSSTFHFHLDFWNP